MEVARQNLNFVVPRALGHDLTGQSRFEPLNWTQVGRATPCAPSSGKSPSFHDRGAQRTARPTRQFMGSPDVQFWTRIGAMNLLAMGASVLPRSMTALSFDAAARLARWVDWFRSATRVSIGEPQGFPLERFVLSGSWPGTAPGHHARL